MLALTSPREAYRRTAFDARIAGAKPGDLVLVCFEQFDEAVRGALHGGESGDNRARSDGLTRALAALAALELGVAPGEALAPALAQLYRAARRDVLDSVLAFDPPRLRALRADFAEIAAALRQAAVG